MNRAVMLQFVSFVLFTGTGLNAAGLSVDRFNRASVAQFYQEIYNPNQAWDAFRARLC